MSDLRTAWTIARRELRGGIAGFRVFLICLALGVAAIAAIGTVRESIDAGLQREGAALLGGDAAIELTYRFADSAERTVFEIASDNLSEIADFRSMLVVSKPDQEERGLTQVKAVDELYPLYGSVILSPDIPLEQALAGQNGLPGIVVDPVLLDRLAISVGEIARLGTQEFVVMAALQRVPDEAGAGFTLGPRSIVALEALDASGLLEPGTLFETEYRLTVATGTDLDALRQQVETALPDAGIRWRDRRNGAPGIAEFVDRLSAFLVLVGLTGLAVGGVGVAAAVRAYLAKKTETIATLRSLGATGRVIFLTYILQIGVLSLLGISIGIALGSPLPLLFGPLLEARLPVPAAFSLTARPLIEAGFYGILSAALFTLWPLARTENIRAANLFRASNAAVQGWPRPLWLGILAALFAVLVGTAAILSGLMQLTLWAAAGLVGAFLILIGAAMLTRHLARRASKLKALAGRPTLRSALGAIGGLGGDAGAVILSLGLGLSVLAAIGQINWNLQSAIDRDLPDVAPSYFVVDIQSNQLPEIRDMMGENPAVIDFQSAPMLRGIITKINGKPAVETAGDHWVLQGDRGITYSQVPPAETKITQGAWWDKDAVSPEISFAAEEAAEMGLSLGDSMTLNVLGRELTATVTSFREVDFSTAGIGFILSMNPTALQGAPHTHIATIYADENAEGAILRDISSQFPNITAIRMRDAIGRVSDVLAGIAAAITYGALATLLTGGVVLIGTAAAGEQARIYEGAILKTLGATRREILLNFALRSVILGAVAGGFAILAGGLAGWAVMHFVMDSTFQLEPVSALGIVFGGILVTLLTGAFFAWRPLAAKPARVLRARE